MALFVPALATSADIVLPAGARLAAFSDSNYDVLQVGITGSLFPPMPVPLSFNTANKDQLVTSTFASGATLRIVASGGADVFYSVGTDAVVQRNRSVSGWQSTPGVLNATGALTSAMILSGIVTSTTGAAVAGTLPTAAVLDLANSFAIGESFEFTVIATGANAFTVTTAAGWTLVGVMAVATVTSGTFRALKTAAGAYSLFRL